MKNIDMKTARRHIKKRDADTHKGSYGRVLVIAGWGGMPGACVFTAKAAIRSGAGLVYICTDDENRQVVQTLVPEAILISPEDVRSRITGEKLDWNFDAVAFGPGMGTGNRARELFDMILEGYAGKLVVDADGLNLLSLNSSRSQKFVQNRSDRAITPHPGEASRLLERYAGEKIKTREGGVKKLSEVFLCAAVLKGNETLVFDGRNVFKNTTGNPGMATAGSGDVLTGILLSFMGQGMNAFDASLCSVFVHGLAGDVKAKELGEYSLTASDIIEGLPQAFKMIVG